MKADSSFHHTEENNLSNLTKLCWYHRDFKSGKSQSTKTLMKFLTIRFTSEDKFEKKIFWVAATSQINNHIVEREKRIDI